MTSTDHERKESFGRGGPEQGNAPAFQRTGRKLWQRGCAALVAMGTLLSAGACAVGELDDGNYSVHYNLTHSLNQ